MNRNASADIVWIPNEDITVSGTYPPTFPVPVSPSRHINIPVLSLDEESVRTEFAHPKFAGDSSLWNYFFKLLDSSSGGPPQRFSLDTCNVPRQIKNPSGMNQLPASSQLSIAAVSPCQSSDPVPLLQKTKIHLHGSELARIAVDSIRELENECVGLVQRQTDHSYSCSRNGISVTNFFCAVPLIVKNFKLGLSLLESIGDGNAFPSWNFCDGQLIVAFVPA